MGEIDHSHTDNAVCPHCGTEHRDSWEFGALTRSDSGETDCHECGKPFTWVREIEVTYSTRPVRGDLSAGAQRE